MLELPFADDDRTFDGLGLPEGEVPLYSFAWHPRLVLLPTWRWMRERDLIKRLVDVGFALPALVLLAVPALFLALAIRLDSPGPVLFRQQRIGLSGRKFTALKFRTMYWDPTDSGTLRQAAHDDPRVTRIGPLAAALLAG